MAAVVIGVDPAKRSNTIEVIDSDENVLLMARFENSSADYRKMRALVKRWPWMTTPTSKHLLWSGPFSSSRSYTGVADMNRWACCWS